MNHKIVLLFIVIAVVVTIFGMETMKLNCSLKNNQTETISYEKQVDYLSRIQKQVNEIMKKDKKIQDFIEGRKCLKIAEIIYNESYVEEVYRIGFNYKNIDNIKGYQLVGGKIYKFSINLSNESVTSIKEVENFSLDESVIDDVWRENTNTSVHSATSIKGTIGLWRDLRNIWTYTFKISSTGEVQSRKGLSSSQGNGCFKSSVFINELFNKNQFFLNIDENDPEAIKTWCDNGALPLIKNKVDTESLGVQVSYPLDGNKIRSYPSEAGFSYYWETSVYPNQTIMFDVDATFESIDNTKNIDEITHNWLVILSPPPSPDELSEDEMKEYGIWANDHGNYYSTNVTYVKKGDWLENECEIS